MKNDYLHLASNKQVRKMLIKIGYTQELVLFSDCLVKINKKGKEQTRALMITDRAIYNLLPNDLKKCKRRILLEQVGGISVSQTSNEFVIHVKDEYDYRFKSSRKLDVAEVISRAVSVYFNRKVKKIERQQATLENIAITKKEARIQTREQRRLRYEALLREDGESDDEDMEDTQDTKAMGVDVDDGLGLPGRPIEHVTVADFDFLKVLGRGNFGKVMQVRKKNTGKVFAMKILKKQAILQKQQLDHTWSERNILARSNHPFLMKMRWAFQTKAKLYFVLDFYTGGELFFHLKKQRRFSESQARIIVAEVAMALGHLHSLGVVYRDLKPENILVDLSGHICLTDFGLSKKLDEDDEALTFCGTPEYLAPEMIQGAGHNKAVDWWALGILLYELVVGIPPFYSKDVKKMYDSILWGILRFPPFVSDDCQNVIEMLLIREPRRRLGSSERDVDEIREQPFFRKLDWDRLYNREVEPLYKPPRAKNPASTINFEESFLRQPAAETPSEEVRGSDADGFTFFSFDFRKENRNGLENRLE